ncbi:MAG: Uncharacterised protein [Synechococcus sp. MIT S9220]|nr:MAG: Uncharacterised protein [Synechococcus sp. MIT S9220]
MPPQMPKSSPPLLAKRISSASSPLLRREARSRRVCLLPGITTASGDPSASPGAIQRSSTVGSASRGSRSEKLLSEGSFTTAISSSALRLRPLLSSRSRESSGGKSSSSHGITPRTGMPVLVSSQRRPSSKSSRLPRNRLTSSPRISRRSSGFINWRVPMIWANTPPRSISATSRQLACRYLARRRLVRSRACRLTSTGLPAPSSTSLPPG